MIVLISLMTSHNTPKQLQGISTTRIQFLLFGFSACVRMKGQISCSIRILFESLRIVPFSLELGCYHSPSLVNDIISKQWASNYHPDELKISFRCCKWKDIAILWHLWAVYDIIIRRYDIIIRRYVLNLSWWAPETGCNGCSWIQVEIPDNFCWCKPDFHFITALVATGNVIYF